MLAEMLLAVDHELWKYEQAHGRPPEPPYRPESPSLGWRVLGWAGRIMVRWGLRLQERYAPPVAVQPRWAARESR